MAERSPLLPGSISGPPLATVRTLSWLRVIILSIVVAVSGGASTVTTTLWVTSFGSYAAGPYAVVLISSSCSLICFAVAVGLIYWRRRYSLPSFGDYWGIVSACGVSDAANGILVTFASDSTRTPPLLQTILGNFNIFWAMIFTRVLVQRKKHISYLSLLPILALWLILSGIGYSLLPTIMAIAKGQESFFHGSGGGLYWPLIFLAGCIPAALFNVLQERFIEKREEESAEKIIPNGSRLFDMCVCLFWGFAFQSLCMVLFFWVNLVPGFGYASSFPVFGDQLKEAFQCVLNQLPGCQSNWWLGLLVQVSYNVNYFGAICLSEESANFTMIALMLSSPVGALFWILFPSVNGNSSTTPLWSFLPSVTMLLIGTALWKYWERGLFGAAAPAPSPSININGDQGAYWSTKRSPRSEPPIFA